MKAKAASSPPSASTRNSTVARLSRPAARASATAASRIRSRTRTPSPGAGAISISFWRWRWMLHSRSQTWVTPPDRSPATWTSMWRARGKSRSA